MDGLSQYFPTFPPWRNHKNNSSYLEEPHEQKQLRATKSSEWECNSITAKMISKNVFVTAATWAKSTL
jgi:hypothetical protein